MNTAMKWGEDAIKCVVSVGFLSNYVDENGRIPWEAYKEKIGKVAASAPFRVLLVMRLLLLVLSQCWFACWIVFVLLSWGSGFSVSRRSGF